MKELVPRPVKESRHRDKHVMRPPSEKGSNNLRFKKGGGGIKKDAKLTAIEKRRRMVEAGRKFTALNVASGHLPADQKLAGGLVEGPSKLPLPSRLTAPSTSKLMSFDAIAETCKVVNKGQAKQSDNPPPFFQSQLTFRRAPSSSIKATVREKFEKSASSLRDIINQRPIAHVIGRTSCGRQRLSLFPNGINPLDESSSTRNHHASFLSPRDSIMSSISLRRLSATPTDSSSSQTPSIVGLRSSSNKTPKSVRFNDNVAVKNLSDSKSAAEADQKPCDLLRLDVSDEDLENQLNKLPSEQLARLRSALGRINSDRSSEKMSGDSRTKTHTEEYSEEDQIERVTAKETRYKRLAVHHSTKPPESNCWSTSRLSMVIEEDSDSGRRGGMRTRSSGRLNEPPRPLPNRQTKSRKALSQLYANQRLSTEDE